MSCGELTGPLNLQEIVRDNDDMSYDPKKFTSAVWRGQYGTLQLFPNGKITHSGKPIGLSPRQCIEKYLEMLRSQGHSVHLSHVRTVSRAALYRLSGKINLCTIPGADYNPEIFNAAFVKRGGAAFSVFHTGAVVITGIKDIDQTLGVLVELELLTY